MNRCTCRECMTDEQFVLYQLANSPTRQAAIDYTCLRMIGTETGHPASFTVVAEVVREHEKVEVVHAC